MPEYELAPWVADAWNSVAPYLPVAAGALCILIGGWLLALLIRRLIFKALCRTTLDQKIAAMLGFERDEDQRIERGVAAAGYYTVIALMLVALLDHLQLDTVTRPLLAVLEGVAGAVPSLLKAGSIAAVGFLGAVVLRHLVVKALSKTQLIARLQQLGQSPESQSSDSAELVATIGRVVFWTVIVLTSIPVMEALRVSVLAAPLSAALQTVSTYLPRLVAAAGLLAIGYLLGRLVRFVVAAFIDKLSIDEKLRGLGLSSALQGRTTGSVVGTAAMAFVFLHFAISAIGRLGIDEIGKPLGLVLGHVYDYLPRLFVAALILAVGVFIARVISRIASSLLAAVGFNAFAAHIGLYQETAESKAQTEQGKVVLARGSDRHASETSEKTAREVLSGPQGFRTPADVAGVALAVVVVLLFSQQALHTLELTTLSAILSRFFNYLPNLVVAAVVLACGIWVGGWLKRRIDVLTSASADVLVRALGGIARASALVLASMVALQQLGVGAQLVAIAFALLLGALCLALGLAFGLGGREVAGEILRSAYNRHKR